MEPERNHIQWMPTTKLGWWAFWLALAFFPLQMLWYPLSFIGLGAIPAFLAGICAGVCAVVAVTRDKERALFVFAAMVPLLFVVFFLIGEFTFPH